MKRTLSAATLLLALAACSDSTGSGPKVASVTITPATPSVAVGGTVQLTAAAVDGNNQSANGSFQWNSLDPAQATVNGTGLVTGVSAGTARIVASLGGRADTVTVTVSAGVLKTFNVNANRACDTPINVQARLVAEGAHVLVYEDVQNPTGGFTTAEYQEIATRFENEVWPVNTNNFGTPTDIDGNGKVIVLYTRAVNQLTPANVGYIIGGFQYARDLFPRTASNGLGACAASNVAEMFYMLVPDPNGSINGNVRTKAYVKQGTVGIIGHEFQHLINAGRRLHVIRTSEWEEEVWLNEGLSHIAEELLFIQAAGLPARSNLTIPQVTATAQTVNAFNEYALSNFGRLEEYYADPTSTSPIADNDDLGTRGAIWGFLRYAADRRGGNEQPLWFNLVNSNQTGVDNLSSALGQGTLLPFLRDYGVAVYTDDAVATTSAYQQPSWNFRSILSHPSFGNGQMQLQTFTLAQGVTTNVSVAGGSQAYIRFGVPAGQTAEIRTAAGGTTVAGACTNLTLAVGEVFHGTPVNASVVCLGAGEYVLIPFHGSTNGNSRTPLSVTGVNVVAPTGPPTPARLPLDAPMFSMETMRVQGDGGWHLRLREREAEELAPLVRGLPGGARRTVAADPAPATVTLTYVRTK